MMQNIKDSFYVALRDRLAVQNPERVVTVHGVARPGIVVLENEMPTAAALLAEVFYLRWGEVRSVGPVDGAPQPLLRLTCEITCCVEGTQALSHQDRGRALGRCDGDLLAVCHPARAPLQDFSQTPIEEREQNVFWSRPQLGAIEADGRRLRRTATIEVFAFAEENC
jgi:hypothetical protein